MICSSTGSGLDSRSSCVPSYSMFHGVVQPMQFLVVTGDADLGHDALRDLSVMVAGLHGLCRPMGRIRDGTDLNEHTVRSVFSTAAVKQDSSNVQLGIAATPFGLAAKRVPRYQPLVSRISLEFTRKCQVRENAFPRDLRMVHRAGDLTDRTQDRHRKARPATGTA